MGGLFRAIMFAGLAANKTDFAITQIIEKMYIQKTGYTSNLLNNSQQNLSAHCYSESRLMMYVNFVEYLENHFLN